ncbi:MAG TPA: hypothetical protein VGN11_05270, partial [Candidatus Baltobacteraceae bacterium]|nr:hypothetical protein [Candidatus Baltobacteraceae bacterium]
MISAYFAGLRARLALPARLLVAACGLIAGALLAWYGVPAPVEVLILAVVALVAASAGFPLGAVVTIAVSVIDYLSPHGHGGSALLGAGLLFASGLVISVLFYGRVARIEDFETVMPGQLAFAAGPRRALPRGETGGATQVSIAALASGIREVSQGDFTKNIAVSDIALQDLAIALNKLIFGMRAFLGKLHTNASSLDSAGTDLRSTA